MSKCVAHDKSFRELGPIWQGSSSSAHPEELEPLDEEPLFATLASDLKTTLVPLLFTKKMALAKVFGMLLHRSFYRS